MVRDEVEVVRRTVVGSVARQGAAVREVVNHSGRRPCRGNNGQGQSKVVEPAVVGSFVRAD